MLATAAFSLAILLGMSSPGPGDDQAPTHAQDPQGGPLRRVTIGYFLNDGEQDPAQVCHFALLVDGTEAQPVSSDGVRFQYAARPGAQAILLSCERHLHYSQAAYDYFVGDMTVVMSVYTQTDLLVQDRDLPTPIPFDDHYLTVVGHTEGRWRLRDEWLKLPALVQRDISAAGVVSESDGGTGIATTCWMK